MGPWVSVIGAAVVLLVLWDAFCTLFYPSGHGPLCKTVMSMIWRACDRFGRRARAVAGPLGMLSVVAVWGGLAVTGWALVYWPFMPESFSFSAGLRPDARSDLLDALYLSMVAIATLGLGDIMPVSGWLRLAVPVEALVGFALLTGAVSWVLQIYPALTRRRGFAAQLALLRRASPSDIDDSVRAQAVTDTTLDTLTGLLVQVHIDLEQYGSTYYFNDNEARTSLASQLPFAADLAGAAARSSQPEVRLAGAVLGGAVDDLAALLDSEYLRTGGPTSTVLDAYRATHPPAGRPG